jgi:ADP-ribosyl-[dinitrogen reductase] hydrolase
MTFTSSVMGKYRGALVGLAIGDTLGMAIEFETRGDFEPVTKPRAGGPFDLPLGYWTDDTSMALCLADSLLERGGYDSFDVLQKYSRWSKQGYRSSTGACFDIGGQVSASVDAYDRPDGKIVHTDMQRSSSAGNGSIMRLAPVIIAAHATGLSLEQAMELARLSGRETHYSTEAEAGTAFFGALLYNSFTATTKAAIFAYGEYSVFQSDFDRIAVIAGKAKAISAGDIKPSGYIVNSLVAAVWAFMNHENFKDGALAAVNLGGDSDTIGAIYGQLAGIASQP